jgi:signal transduction histidine kinase
VTATNVVERVGPTYPGELILDLDGLDGTGSGLRGNATEWERSLLNLVENGCRAAGPHGKVLVRCRSTDDTLTISVADSGPGFGQGSAGRSSLGMVGVMHLVEHHGGHLELRRSDLGGALLIIVVPLAPNGTAPPRGDGPRPAAPR